MVGYLLVWSSPIEKHGQRSRKVLFLGLGRHHVVMLLMLRMRGPGCTIVITIEGTEGHAAF